MKELLAGFAAEVFKPIVTLLIPGFWALTPWTVAMFLHYPTSWVFASKHKDGSGLVFAITATALGMILEDLGARVEKICEGRGADNSDWYDYLALAFDPQPIGLRYIRTVVLRMKFEFGMGLGGVIAAWGVLCTPIILTMKLLSISIAVALTVYFFHEGSCSVKLLKKTRLELLKRLLAKSPPEIKVHSDRDLSGLVLRKRYRRIL